MTVPPAGSGRPGTPSWLDIDVRLRRRSFTLDVALSAEPGEVVAILGPNGAGKSTLLGIVSGLLSPHDGRVVLGGRTLTSDGVQVPPARRRIGLMGQDPLLFPHLSALENIAFGPRAQGEPRARARADARDWLDRLGLAEFAERRPARLSGGQRQRVALARALAAKPELLLLDEPLGALDAQTAPEIRQVLRTHIRAGGLTTLLVTHDVLDAATLADRVIVLQDGAVTETGSTAEVFTAPRSSFTAALAGVNMVPGIAASAAEQGSVALVHPVDPVEGLPEVSGIAVEALPAGEGAMAVFSPSAVAVYPAPVAGSPRNAWPATVVGLEPGPSSIRVRARLTSAADDAAPGGTGSAVMGGAAAASRGAPGPADGALTIAADLTPAAVAELGLQPGSPVHLAVKATEVRIYAR